MEVIKYVVSEEFQLQMSKEGLSVPILKDDKITKVFAEENEFKSKNNQAVFVYPFAKPAAKTKYDASAETQLGKALLEAANETTDLNTALRKAEEVADKAIEDAMKK
jgi:multiple sugar transport system substrate-binding protein